jgi:hypothetical protein
MNKTLSRRLERLEERILPSGDPPIEHIIRFVEADGTVVETMVIQHRWAHPGRDA